MEHKKIYFRKGIRVGILIALAMIITEYVSMYLIFKPTNFVTFILNPLSQTENSVEKNLIIIFLMIVFSIYLSTRVYYQFGKYKDIAIELEQKQKELNLTYKKLKQSEIEKNQFIRTASHELKTPITNIRTFTGFMIEGTNSKKKLKLLKQIAKDTETLNKMTDQMIAITKKEAGIKE